MMRAPRLRSRNLRALALGLALLGTAGCAASPGELTLATPDRAAFETSVYPVLLRDCGFHACHGSSERFFQAYGPGRGRLLANTQPLDPADPLEIEHTYWRAVSMIDGKDPASSLLLTKPLAPSAGGAGHQGVDSLGRDVYVTTMDAGYVALQAWVMSQALAAPTPGTPPAP